MAVVTSLTDSKIQELMAGWQIVGLSQEEINSLVIQIRAAMESHDAQITELRETTLPALQEDLAAGSIKVSELNEKIPDLENTLAEAQLQLDDIQNIIVPSMQESIDNTTQNIIDRPKTYVQPEAPENPDEEDRYLVVGDGWFDSDDNNRQRIWNGVEWSTFGIDIPDFSVTVRKFMSSTHLIY